MGLQDSPTAFSGKHAQRTLDEFSRFTATMVCIIAALEAFSPQNLLKTILKQFLLELLQTSDWGDDVLASNFDNRIISWQFSADVRGLSSKAREIRQNRVNRKSVLDGLMPPFELRSMVEFLAWLVAGQTSTYITPSSDLAGVGYCLAHLGMDILSVTGLGDESPSTPCRLEYRLDILI